MYGGRFPSSVKSATSTENDPDDDDDDDDDEESPGRWAIVELTNLSAEVIVGFDRPVAMQKDESATIAARLRKLADFFVGGGTDVEATTGKRVATVNEATTTTINDATVTGAPNYVARTEAWARDVDASPFDERASEAVLNAATMRVGLASEEVRRLRAEEDELTVENVVARQDSHLLEEKRRELVAARRRLRRAHERSDETRLAVAARFARRRARDRCARDAAFEAAVEAEPDELKKLRETMRTATTTTANNDNEQQPPRPNRRTVSFAVGPSLAPSSPSRKKKEETSLDKGTTSTEPLRHELSTQSRELLLRRKTIEPDLNAEAALRVTDHAPLLARPEHLALLYADAQRTLPRLRRLAERVVADSCASVRVVLEPLRDPTRAALDAFGRDDGDHAATTNLVAATFACRRLSDARRVLRTLTATAADDDGDPFVVGPARGNGLAPVSPNDDDDATRDRPRGVALDLRCVATGHVCAVRVALADDHVSPSPFVTTLSLDDPSAYRHRGPLDYRVVEGVRCGLVRELSCLEGASLSTRADLFDALLRALRSPSCVLERLELRSCGWPRSRQDVDVDGRSSSPPPPPTPSIEDLLRSLPAETLRHLSLHDLDGVGGRLPGDAVARLTELRTFRVTSVGLEGTIPPQIAGERLAELRLGNNHLRGTVPAELFERPRLRVLKLENNELSGPLPRTVFHFDSFRCGGNPELEY